MRYTQRKDLQKKLDLKQKKIDAGLVSEKFPKVSNIEIKMKYYWTPLDTFLMLRTVNFHPDSNAYFHMHCAVKGCNKGGFELAQVIGNLVKGSEQKGKGNLVCHGRGEKVSRKHANIEYKVKVKYFKDPE
jgi:hypothetical protein